MRILMDINANNHSLVNKCLDDAGLSGFYECLSDTKLATNTLDLHNQAIDEECFSDACLNLAANDIPFSVGAWSDADIYKMPV